jgi:hypothetical protein
MIRQRIVTKDDAMPYATNYNNLLLRLADLEDAPPAPAESKPAQTDPMLDMIER